MNSKLEKRLAKLEDHAASLCEAEEAALTKEVLSRLSIEEKRWYVAALRRALESEGEDATFAEEDYPILTKVEELRLSVYLGWGRVYHGKGYWRAQYVKPLAIGKLGRPERFDRKGERARWIERLSERYDIPLLQEEDINYYATQFRRWPQREGAFT